LEVLDAGGREQYETEFKARVCTCYWSWNSVVVIVAKLQTGRYGIWIPAKAWNFYVFWNVNTGAGPQLVSCSMGNMSDRPWILTPTQGRSRRKIYSRS